MLILFSQRHGQIRRAKQKGVVLLITLISLVAMTLAAIALMRSVDTSNLVAGNLAFRQAATHFADSGTEQAIAYLFSSVPDKKCSNTGGVPACPAGYRSSNQATLEPPTAASWDAYWVSMKAIPGVVALTNPPSGYCINSGDCGFVIEAWCTADGMANCSVATATSSTFNAQEGQNIGSTDRPLTSSTSTLVDNYYRITTKVQGPRNSVAYIQVFITAP